MALPRLIPLTLALAAATPSSAGEVACRFEAGMVVVPAAVAGIAGDWIVDTGTARTTLHETRAQSAGIAETELSGDVRIAGFRMAARPVAVADLDARTWNLPTPAAGVIGADVMKHFVVDVSFAPCRLALWRPGAAPPFLGGRVLPLSWDAGRPVAAAAVSDGVRTLKGPFVIATGVTAAVRIADDLAAVPAGERVSEYYPDGIWLARLAQLEFAGDVIDDLAAGLVRPEGEAAGVIGAAALSAYRLRFDFPAGRLIVAP